MQNSPPANNLLGYRLLANCFMFDPVRPKLLEFEKEILANSVSIFKEANKNTKLAVATALLKYVYIRLAVTELIESLSFSSLRLLTGNLSAESLVGVLAEFVHAAPDDDILILLLVALGTLVRLGEFRIREDDYIFIY